MARLGFEKILGPPLHAGLGRCRLCHAWEMAAWEAERAEQWNYGLSTHGVNVLDIANGAEIKRGMFDITHWDHLSGQ
jgi:hypothetical protein